MTHGHKTYIKLVRKISQNPEDWSLQKFNNLHIPDPESAHDFHFLVWSGNNSGNFHIRIGISILSGISVSNPEFPFQIRNLHYGAPKTIYGKVTVCVPMFYHNQFLVKYIFFPTTLFCFFFFYCKRLSPELHYIIVHYLCIEITL